MDGWMNRKKQKDGWIYINMDGKKKIDGWMKKQMDGWMNRKKIK